MMTRTKGRDPQICLVVHFHFIFDFMFKITFGLLPCYVWRKISLSSVRRFQIVRSVICYVKFTVDYCDPTACPSYTTRAVLGCKVTLLMLGEWQAFKINCSRHDSMSQRKRTNKNKGRTGVHLRAMGIPCASFLNKAVFAIWHNDLPVYLLWYSGLHT